MIVERLQRRELDGMVERSALFRWGSGEAPVSIAVPAELATEGDDASPFLPLALLPSMRRGEDLVVDGPVSPRLVRGAARAMELYRAWHPPLHEVGVEVAEERESHRVSSAVGCFFSRGVDSTYTAAVPRSYPGEIERLVFISGFDPFHEEAVMAEEVRRANLAAERIGVPLTVVHTRFWDAVTPSVGNGDDINAPAVALAGLALGGAVGTMVLPTIDDVHTLMPDGTHPLLDGLFSTEAVRLVHDHLTTSRIDKGLWLARERPDLLAQIKVCWRESRADNCGRCHKCLQTMATFQAVGKLDAAEQFPDEIDLDAVKAVKLQTLVNRKIWSDLARALDPQRDGELRRLVLERLDDPSGTFPGAVREDTPDFRVNQHARLEALIRYGRPWPPQDDTLTPPGYGLVRAIDRARGRHAYALGALPSGEVLGELGSLPREASADGSDPVVLTEGGYVVSEAASVARPHASPSAVLRWVLAPLAWRDVREPAPLRALAVLERLWGLRRRRERSTAPLATVGHVYREGGARRLPLHSAIHPVTGDQLLSTNPWEANDMGYGTSVLLGYIDAAAPVTGRLGTGRPRVPWASRFGQRVRTPGEKPVGRAG